jgi:hypothetical protein
MLGKDGITIPLNTMLPEDLHIENGVAGEDLIDTANTQTAAVEELLRMVNRKVADHKGEGQYVWKKLTAEDGDFIDYVVSSDTGTYPDGGTQDGYWYERLQEHPKTNRGVITLTGQTTDSESYVNVLKIAHGLGVVPSYYQLDVTKDYEGCVAGAHHALGGVYNFKSLVPGCLEVFYCEKGTGDIISRSYQTTESSYYYIRHRVDSNYIYIDVRAPWMSNGNYKYYGAIPSGTLYWVAIA